MPEILIVDDHPSVRQGVKQFITDEMPGSVFGEAETAADALRQLLKRRFRAVVLDLSLPGEGRPGIRLGTASGISEHPDSDPEFPLRGRMCGARAAGGRVGICEQGRRAGGVAAGATPGAGGRKVSEPAAGAEDRSGKRLCPGATTCCRTGSTRFYARLPKANR